MAFDRFKSGIAICARRRMPPSVVVSQQAGLETLDFLAARKYDISAGDSLRISRRNNVVAKTVQWGSRDHRSLS